MVTKRRKGGTIGAQLIASFGKMGDALRVWSGGVVGVRMAQESQQFVDIRSFGITAKRGKRATGSRQSSRPAKQKAISAV